MYAGRMHVCVVSVRWSQTAAAVAILTSLTP